MPNKSKTVLGYLVTWNLKQQLSSQKGSFKIIWNATTKQLHKYDFLLVVCSNFDANLLVYKI